MTTTDGTALLEAARAGDAAARERLVTLHLDTVRAVCGSRLRSPHDVADATQETFLRALAALDQVRDAASLDAWLRAIAVRVCADHGRHVARAVCVADPVGDTASDSPGPSDVLLADEEASRLHSTLATLATRDRQALWLRDAIGLPVAHVAADLGLTEGSARVLLSRARQRLRTAYEGAAGIAAVGLLRLRGRLAELGPADLRVAMAAQLTIVAVAVGVAVPRMDAAPVEPPAPAVPAEGRSDDVTAEVVRDVPDVSSVGGASAQDVGGPPSGEAAAPGGAGDAPPPVVTVGTDEPDGPSRFGVATSDGDGGVAGLELWGGPITDAAGATGDASEHDGAEDAEAGDEGDGRLPLGPIQVVPGRLPLVE